jgi:protein TonB
MAISVVLHAGLLVLEPGLDTRLRNPLAEGERMLELSLDVAAVARPSAGGEDEPAPGSSPAPADALPVPASPPEEPLPAVAVPLPATTALTLDPASASEPDREPPPESNPEPTPVAATPVPPPPAAKPAAPEPPPKAKPRRTKPVVRPTEPARAATPMRKAATARMAPAMAGRGDGGAAAAVGHGAQSASTAKALNGHALAAARPALLAAPVARHAPPPEYPEEARWEERTGATTLAFRIRPTGAPSDIEILASSGHADLDRAAVQALGRWRFQIDGGAPQDARYRYRFRFRLD